MSESDLYPTVKRFFERAGFACKGEVCGCDIVAVPDAAPGRLAIVQMKLGFNLDLLLQAVDRSRAADVGQRSLHQRIGEVFRWRLRPGDARSAPSSTRMTPPAPTAR